MQGKISLYNEIVSAVMHFIAGLSFFLTSQMIILGGPGPLYVQVIFVLVFASVMVIRHFINGNFLIYTIAHLTLFLTLFTIPVQSVMFIVFAAYLIIMTAWSVTYWRNNGEKTEGNVPWAAVILFCITYIYAFVDHHNILKNYLLVTGCIYFLLFMVRLYLHGLYGLSKDRLFHKQLPFTQIVRTNSYMIGVVIAFTAIAMIVAAIINLDDLLYVIADGFIVILRVVIKSFFIVLTWVANLFKNVDYTGIERLWDDLGNALSEDGLVSKILNLIFAALKILITAVFLMWLARGMNIKIRQYLKDNILPTDKVERIRTKENGFKTTVEKIIKGEGNEPKSPVRRRYKRAVKRFGTKLVLTPSMTVGQIEAQMSEEEAENMKELKTAYEKERYRDEQNDI